MYVMSENKCTAKYKRNIGNIFLKNAVLMKNTAKSCKMFIAETLEKHAWGNVVLA